MYEFLDENMSYDRLDEYQKHKADWLEETTRYLNKTKRTYWIHLNTKVHYIEDSNGKDLFDFDKQEIIKLVKYAPTNSLASKTALYTTIARYMDWACEKGLNYVGNPCDTIDTKELFVINKLALKKSYQTLQEFYEFISELECTDVDRAMFTLLRYGVKVDDVGTVKWEDIDRKNKVININKEEILLQLPIDSIFAMIIDKAKSCETRISGKREINYLDFGYIVKAFEGVGWQHMSSDKVYNRAGEITRKNRISRISVPELNNSRKYDLLFDVLDKKGKMSSSDIEQLLLRMDGCSTTSKKGLLKKDFQLLSEIIVEKMKIGIKKGRKRNINESDNKTALMNTDDIYNIVDTQDGSDEDEIDKSIEDSHGNVLSHEYKPKEKVYNEVNIDKSIYRRDTTVVALALKLANYECQLNKDHKTFISNTTSKNYVEAHHLIPMQYYYSSEFKKSIDNEANIVVLCPVCHRRLHYGKFEDKKKLLKYLYDEYNDKLNKAKIGIKWDRLLEMYIECSLNTNEVK